VSRVGLRQVLGRPDGIRGVVDALAAALGGAVAIEDRDGRLLYGEAPPAEPVPSRVAVSHGESPIGWVTGPPHAQAMGALLDHLVVKEVERKALGAEVLHLYREINLIYSFSEKLAALLEVDRVAELALREARHLIVATDGAIMLLDEASGALSTVAGFGDELPHLTGFGLGVGILGAVATSGLAEIVNDVETDVRRVTQGSTVRALIIAPLKVGERVIGVMALGSTMPMSYTAAELKLLSTLGLQAATAIENARLFERTVEAALERERLMTLQAQTEMARAKLQNELDLAARIQANLFPAELPSLAGYDLAARNRAARRCGGDYYDALPVTAHDGAARVLFCVADVSGKGLPASLVMSNMQATLRALLGRVASLPDLAARASDLLFAATSPEKYVTAAFLDLEPRSGQARFVSAGHLDNLWGTADGRWTSLQSTGLPLGLLPDGPPYTETAFVLAPGDQLLLYSDGVTEAQNDAGEEFGEERLQQVVEAAAGENAAVLADRIIAAIDAFAGAAPQFDDITLMVVRRL
jgi:sigma-B regulation protein RsbU (phosphoserine phosphatase)